MGVTDKIIKEAKVLAKATPTIATTDKRESSEIITEVLPQITPDMLPKEISDYVQDVCERIESPFGVGVVSVLTIIGNLIGSKAGIRPKNKDDWTVVPNLWGLIIGRPSVKKTAVYSELLKAVSKIEAESYKEHKKAMERYEKEMEKYDEKKKLCAKNGEEFTLVKPEIPIQKRFVTRDATIEAIAEIVKYNPNGILQTRDELSGFLKMMDKAGKEGDRAFYLEGWNGTGSYSSDRITRSSIYIPRLTLGILGNIQPAILKQYIYEAVQGERADGFLQRFQLALFMNPVPQKGTDRYPNTKARNVFFELIKKIAEAEKFIGCEDDDIPFYRFDEQAQELFFEWYINNSQEATRANNDAFEAHLSKYPKLICSLSLIFHICEVVSSGEDIRRVSKENFERAYKIVEVLKTHAYHLYSTFEREDAQREEMHNKIEAKIKELHQQNKLPMSFGEVSKLVRGARAKDVEVVAKGFAIVRGRKIFSVY